MNMCSTCVNVLGLLVLLAGLSFLAFGQGWWPDGAMVHTLAGVLLVIVGIGKVSHGLGMCPSCKMPTKK